MAKGDVLGATDCPGCGREVQVTETKKATGHIRCHADGCGFVGFFNGSMESLRPTQEETQDDQDQLEEEPAGVPEGGSDDEAGEEDDGSSGGGSWIEGW